MRDPKFIVVDLFCGAGGTGTGFDQAKNIYGDKLAYVVAAVNHDPIAILSHWENYPEVHHFTEDITELYGHVTNGFLFMTEHMRQLVRLVNIYRAFYPKSKIILWASLECTNFSKAKGGMARDGDSRTLADHLDRYVAALDPDYIQIENVVEFMAWGPLNEKGRPISMKNGRDWIRWKQHICSFGYHDDWREMNSANFGAFTSRNRLFGIFAKPGLPISWPKPTHAKKPQKNGMFGDLKKWMPVKECLDFEDTGESIFNRKKPLVQKTLERIYAGLIKFVANGDDSFLSKYYSGDPDSKNISIFGPADTITKVDHHAMITTESFLMQSNGGQPHYKVTSEDNPARTITTSNNQSAVFLAKYNSSNASGKVSAGTSIEEPCHTLAVQQRIAVVNAEFLVKFNNNETTRSLDDPSPVLTTKDKLSVVLMKYYGSNQCPISTESPCDTLTTKDRFAAVFLDQQYGNSKPSGIDEVAATLTANPKLAIAFIDRNFTTGGGKHVDVDGPMGSLLTVPKANLVQAERWIMVNAFDRSGSSVEDPAPTIVATGTRHYLMNPQYMNAGSSTEQPCFTLIARMDKAPPYLVSTEEGDPVILIYPEDSEIMQKIKLFMASYGIVDIKMRMLKVKELLKIQGFPKGYKLRGTQSDQKKFIGNSVVPHVVKAWTEVLAA